MQRAEMTHLSPGPRHRSPAWQGRAVWLPAPSTEAAMVVSLEPKGGDEKGVSGDLRTQSIQEVGRSWKRKLLLLTPRIPALQKHSASYRWGQWGSG